MGLLMSFWISVLVSFKLYLEVELLAHTVVLYFMFGGPATLFSIVAAPTYIPTKTLTISLGELV